MITRIKPNPWKTRLFLLALAVGGVAATGFYYYTHPENLPEWAARTSLGRQMQTSTVYKWQDNSGHWHLSDQPPPSDVPYQTDQYTHDTNVLPLPPKLRR
jgi:hypothetical protein